MKRNNYQRRHKATIAPLYPNDGGRGSRGEFGRQEEMGLVFSIAASATKQSRRRSCRPGDNTPADGRQYARNYAQWTSTSRASRSITDKTSPVFAPMSRHQLCQLRLCLSLSSPTWRQQRWIDESSRWTNIVRIIRVSLPLFTICLVECLSVCRRAYNLTSVVQNC